MELLQEDRSILEIPITESFEIPSLRESADEPQQVEVQIITGRNYEEETIINSDNVTYRLCDFTDTSIGGSIIEDSILYNCRIENCVVRRSQLRRCRWRRSTVDETCTIREE